MLSLDTVAEDIYERIAQFCNQKEERAWEIELEYQNYHKSIMHQLPEKIQKGFSFHDCKITRLEQQGNMVIIELDNRGGFTNVCKVIYENATIIVQEDIVGSIWVHDEVFLIHEGYEFHTLLQDGEGTLRYLTLTTQDIELITEDMRCN